MTDDYTYHVYDETSIPLSNTATRWIKAIERTHVPLLNSTSVAKILLRNAPAPTTFSTPKFTSLRLGPENQKVLPAPSRNVQKEINRGVTNFLSPTEAAKSRLWKKSHSSTYLRPISHFQHVHKARLATARKNRDRMHKRKRKRNKQLKPLTLHHSIDSGKFYQERRNVRMELEQNRRLQMLEDRRVRMEGKLQETLRAWTLMHRVVGDAMNALIDSEPTPKQGKRKYPRLLQSMERDRKRLQTQLERMTQAVNDAHEEERSYVEHVRTTKLPPAKTVKPMKVKTSRTLM